MNEPTATTPTTTPTPAQPLTPEALATAIVTWFTEGHSQADVADAIRQYAPRADPEALITAAVDTFAQRAAADRNTLLGWALEANREMYRRLVEMRDYGTALRAIRQLVELADLLPEPPDEPPPPPPPPPRPRKRR